MTGRSSFGSQGRDQAGEGPEGSGDAGDGAADLESELLNDLQASFAALGGPFQDGSAPAGQPEAQAPRRTPEPRQTPEPEPARPPADDLTLDFEKSVEEVLAELEGATRVQPPAPPEPEPAPPFAPEPEPDHGPVAGAESFAPFAFPDLPSVTEEPEQPPLPPVDRMPLPDHPEPEAPPPAVMRRDRGNAPEPRRPVPPEPAEAPEPPPRPERRVRPRAPEPAERSKLSRLKLRPAPPPVRPIDDEEDEAVAERPSRRKERMERALRPRERASGFAPPRAPMPPPPEAAPEPHIGFQDAESLGEAPDLDDPSAGFDEGFSLEDLDTAAFAPEDDLPPFPEEELAGLKRRRSGRAIAAVGGILVIAVVGAAAFFLTQGDSGSGSPPPIITADGEPSKVFPDEAAADTDQQGKLIYDRVDDGDGSDTTLVATGDDPIAEVSPDEDLANNPISRVIIPGGPGVDGPMESGDNGAGGEMVVAEADPSDGSESALGPKKVRTVVVRPDGTIVSSEAVEEGGDAVPGDEAPGAVPGDEFSNLADNTRTDMDAVLDGQDLPVVTDPLGVTTGDGTEAIPNPPPGTVPAEDETVAAVEEAAEPVPLAVPEPAAPKPAAPKPAAAPAKPTIVATTGDANGPIDLTPGTSGGSSGPRAGSGGVLVQVSAQRTEDAARSTYRSLQSRYPSILGPYQAAIIRADLGDRGIYYRVRIGPFSSGDATRLCNDLKSAGGDCILAR
ncbi:MAG: SPOR domain-containing protein [Bauldia sp.]|uniref:SPOR domain-containing protein n=1 Tax=Bauldia sp. TaxID=2575872 RepID=UPI001D9DBBD6|nr:SPOR domain-containing protein [Bauldia sp.]MCB1495329.1 SPOR domain-containing protein [Bauldia sp.]